MESIEASGKSVEDAVLQGLARLKKRRDEVEVVVLQEPSRGAFGIGNKEARVRVNVRSASAVITPEMADALLGPMEDDSENEIFEEDEEDEFEEDVEEEDGEDEDTEEYDEDEYEDEEDIGEGELGADQFSSPLPTAAIAGMLAGVDDISVAEGEMQEVENPSNEDVQITVDVLQHILQYMSIRAVVQVRSTSPLTLNIQGINENLGLLIGRRGETLSALQLLVSLIVGHRTKHRMRITIDAENYRERREENLRSLAMRVAQQVRNYRRSIALEAMPPHERRIVHIALADSKDISTESIGEGDERRVVISLKRPGR
ncbi:MAG TPA: RNA-binding cell elongation regulator Jag/EloR [Ktedonobacteraceae bacterium]|nr:RNA-binding cell elongation regulator Jag/EloR [Ktedonobacteraceae bacterium]